MTALSSALESATTVSRTVLVPLLDDVPLPDDVRPGWIAAALVLALILVTVLLWINMRKQLRKIDFREDPDDPDPPSRP